MSVRPHNQRKTAKMKLEPVMGNMSEWREADFANHCTYIVHDQPSDPAFGVPRAMTSIPRNLTFEYSPDNEVSTMKKINTTHSPTHTRHSAFKYGQ